MTAGAATGQGRAGNQGASSAEAPSPGRLFQLRRWWAGEAGDGGPGPQPPYEHWSNRRRSLWIGAHSTTALVNLGSGVAVHWPVAFGDLSQHCVAAGSQLYAPQPLVARHALQHCARLVAFLRGMPGRSPPGSSTPFTAAPQV